MLLTTHGMLYGMTERQTRHALKRELRAELQQQTINRRCASIYKHQIERAAKLNVMGPDYDVAALRVYVSGAVPNGCAYCAKKLTPKNFELDHRTPVSRGGQFSLLNTTLICGPCNKKKGGLTVTEFLRLVELLATFPPEGRIDVEKRLGIGARWSH